jgi:Right handed beta helix region
MTRMKSLFNMLAVFVVCLACSTLAQAQATRTWVSGTGDDANPCSRTAPCKTFAGAISKTAAGGEISVLDPGGFGAVTITKAITLDGDGTLAGILSATVNGIIVNAGANDVVVIRNISINGVGSGLSGIRFLAGRHLRVENCNISGVTTHGIDMVHAGTTGNPAGELTVENTTFDNIGSVAVRMTIAAGGTVAPSANLNNVKITRAGFGFDVLSGVGTISNSIVSQVTNQAAVAEGSATINAAHTVMTKNGTGIEALASTSTIRISACQIFNNGTGVKVAASSVSDRFGDSAVFGNTTDVQGTITLRTNQ